MIVYLAASMEAVSSVMVADRGGSQMPVYFVSKVLQNGEVNYPPIEKLVLALVFTARRLRRYFQAHPVLVLTDQPMRQVITLPKPRCEVSTSKIVVNSCNTLCTGFDETGSLRTPHEMGY